MSYKRILLALDNDDVSRQALEEAVELAKSLRAELRLIHVIDEMMISHFKERSIDVNKEINAFVNSTENFVNNIHGKLRKMGVKFKFEILKITTVNQRVPIEIVEAAKKWKADLIIVGAYSRPGIHRLELGHVAESIIRMTAIPILLVHLQSEVYEKL